jgi:hypothetical protein
VKKNLAIVLIAATLSFGGVTACAQSSPPQSKEPDRAMEEGAKAAEAMNTAVRSSTPEGSNVEKPTMEEETKPSKPEGPPIPSALLEERILKLVDSLRAPNDVTRANVERVMQIKLAQNENIQDWWTHTGITDEGWQYSILFEDKRKEDLPTISIGFSMEDTASTKPIACNYELESFSKKLTLLGYKRFPGWRQPRAHAGFEREVDNARFGSSIHVFKYIWKHDSQNDEYVYCIEGINIYSGIRDNDE